MKVGIPGTSDEDDRLIAAASRGDEVAFAQLFRRHASSILGFLIKMLSRRDLAEEVLQEVFLQAWRDASRFDPGRASVRSWLFLLARSRATDQIRSRSARSQRESARAETDLRTGGNDDPSGRLEARATVQRALTILSPEQQDCVRLSFFEGLSLTQVSERLDIPLGTAKSRYLYGMRKLRQTFAGKGGDHA